MRFGKCFLGYGTFGQEIKVEKKEEEEEIEGRDR